jgi:hypothetical protein
VRRLKVLIWHIHGSYLNALTRTDHDWYLPVKEGRPVGYAGRGRTFDMPPWVREVSADEVASLDLDLVIYQTPENLFVDGPEILSERQSRLHAIYLEHNVPRPDAVNSVHPAVESNLLLVHVTHYNRLMWDNGRLPTRVIEHSVVIDKSARYTGSIESGIVVVNHIDRRARAVGFDLFSEIRGAVPLQLAGMGSEALGGLGDIPYRDLYRTVANYRFLFSPMRYTSLPLAVIEGMTIGMPIVALPTTEVPSVIEDGVTGFLSSDPAVLVEKMRRLLEDPALANRLGNNAREVALQRFGWERFARDWNMALEEAVSLESGDSLSSAITHSNTSPAPVRASCRDRTEPS